MSGDSLRIDRAEADRRYRVMSAEIAAAQAHRAHYWIVWVGWRFTPSVRLDEVDLDDADVRLVGPARCRLCHKSWSINVDMTCPGRTP